MRNTIFAPDYQDDYGRMMLEWEWDVSPLTKGKLIPCIGSYKGTEEKSYICNTEDYENFMKALNNFWVAKQESVLRVSECNKKYTTLEYLSTGETVHLGCMKSVTEQEARSKDAWTYRPDIDTWFITVQGNNDRHWVEKYFVEGSTLFITDRGLNETDARTVAYEHLIQGDEDTDFFEHSKHLAVMSTEELIEFYNETHEVCTIVKRSVIE